MCEFEISLKDKRPKNIENPRKSNRLYPNFLLNDDNTIYSCERRVDRQDASYCVYHRDGVPRTSEKSATIHDKIIDDINNGRSDFIGMKRGLDFDYIGSKLDSVDQNLYLNHADMEYMCSSYNNLALKGLLDISASSLNYVDLKLQADSLAAIHADSECLIIRGYSDLKQERSRKRLNSLNIRNSKFECLAIENKRMFPVSIIDCQIGDLEIRNVQNPMGYIELSGSHIKTALIEKSSCVNLNNTNVRGDVLHRDSPAYTESGIKLCEPDEIGGRLIFDVSNRSLAESCEKEDIELDCDVCLFGSQICAETFKVGGDLYLQRKIPDDKQKICYDELSNINIQTAPWSRELSLKPDIEYNPAQKINSPKRIEYEGVDFTFDGDIYANMNAMDFTN